MLREAEEVMPDRYSWADKGFVPVQAPVPVQAQSKGKGKATAQEVVSGNAGLSSPDTPTVRSFSSPVSIQ